MARGTHHETYDNAGVVSARSGTCIILSLELSDLYYLRKEVSSNRGWGEEGGA
jgi:hypothetical protein